MLVTQYTMVNNKILNSLSISTQWWPSQVAQLHTQLPQRICSQHSSILIFSKPANHLWSTVKFPHMDPLIPNSLCARMWEILSILSLGRQIERIVDSDLYLNSSYFVLSLGKNDSFTCLVTDNRNNFSQLLYS